MGEHLQHTYIFLYFLSLFIGICQPQNRIKTYNNYSEKNPKKLLTELVFGNNRSAPNTAVNWYMQFFLRNNRSAQFGLDKQLFTMYKIKWTVQLEMSQFCLNSSFMKANWQHLYILIHIYYDSTIKGCSCGLVVEGCTYLNIQLMHTVTIRKRYTIIIKNGVARYVNESQIELSIIN